MNNSIETLYAGKKFEKVRSYLKDYGICNINELDKFRFVELLFVPGITREIVDEAKLIYKTFINNLKYNLVNDNNKYLTHHINKTPISDFFTSDHYKQKNLFDYFITTHDAPIAEIFGGIPRICYFIYKCESEGKTMLSQITDADIDEASKYRGVGIKTAIALRKRYAEYRKNYSMPTLALPDQKQQLSTDQYKQISLFDHFITTHDAPIAEIFGDIPRIASFIYICESEGKTMLSQITDADIDKALKLKGIGIKTAIDLRKKYAEYRKNYSMPSLNHPDLRQQLSTPTLDLPDLKQHLSTRAINSLKKLGISTLEDLLSLTPNYLIGKHNLGAKTCQEIMNYCEFASKSAESCFKAVNKNNIASDNLNIPIQLLSYIGIEQPSIDALKLKGIHKVGDIYGKDLSPPDYLISNIISETLKVSVIDNFAMKIGSLKDNYKECMVRRCQGATLQSIGNEIGVTREWVRKIIVNNTFKLVKDADLVAGTLLTTKNNSFKASELQNIFSSEQVALCCKLVLKKSSYVNYLETADTFILKEQLGFVQRAQI